jgi:hypothetical protein
MNNSRIVAAGLAQRWGMAAAGKKMNITRDDTSGSPEMKLRQKKEPG